MPTLEELKEQASKEGTTVKEVAKCLLKNIAILHLEASSDSDLEKYHQALNEAFPHAKGLLKPVIPPEVKDAKELDPYIETLMEQLFDEQLPTPKETPRSRAPTPRDQHQDADSKGQATRSEGRNEHI